MAGPWSEDESEWGEVPNLALTWAEDVLRHAERVRSLRTRSHDMNRAYDRLEEWSPTGDQIAALFRELWAAEHNLVWASYQLERWIARNAKDCGEQPPVDHEWLKTVRDALEHLDEAQFKAGVAKAGAPRGIVGRALRYLPDQQLRIELGGKKLFGLLDPDELVRRARLVVQQVDDALTARGEAMLSDREDT